MQKRNLAVHYGGTAQEFSGSRPLVASTSFAAAKATKSRSQSDLSHSLVTTLARRFFGNYWRRGGRGDVAGQWNGLPC